MLTELDKKLIRALQQDGRATHAALSRKLGMHVSTISKKIQFFETSGMVKIRALPNPYKLGYCAHAVIGLQVDPVKIDDVCARLGKIFQVNLIVTTFGDVDILAIVFFPSWQDLFDFLSGCRTQADGIRDIQTYFVNEMIKRNYGFSNDSGASVKIDEIDQRLMEKLAENGRFTAQYLATELGISLPTCMRRLAFLLNEKVIAVKALPNPAIIGIKASAIVFLRIKPNKVAKVSHALKAFQEVFLTMTLYNNYNVVVGLNAAGPAELYRFIKNYIMPLDGVVSANTLIQAELKKRYYGGYLHDDPLQDKYDLNFLG